MTCRPPRPSFLGLSPFWFILDSYLCTYLLLYLVPLPQISAIRRPIVTKFCGRNQDLFICNRPKNDRFREIFRGTSGPPKVNRFLSKVIFPEFLYFFLKLNFAEIFWVDPLGQMLQTVKIEFWNSNRKCLKKIPPNWDFFLNLGHFSTGWPQIVWAYSGSPWENSCQGATSWDASLIFCKFLKIFGLRNFRRFCYIQGRFKSEVPLFDVLELRKWDIE